MCVISVLSFVLAVLLSVLGLSADLIVAALLVRGMTRMLLVKIRVVRGVDRLSSVDRFPILDFIGCLRLVDSVVSFGVLAV